MSSDRYRDDRSGQGFRGGNVTGDERSVKRGGDGRRSNQGPEGSGQPTARWADEQNDWNRAPQGGYRSQDLPYAESQGDGEPYEGGRPDRMEGSGGSAHWSEGGERSSSPGVRYGRGSGSYDGFDRGPRSGSQSGGGYGEYNYKDEYSPRGHSIRGDSGPTGSPRRASLGESAETPRGKFTGKGPKGYQRSDDRVREDVSEALERNGELDASEIEVQVQGGEVTLQGTVPDRSSKRLAEDLIEELPGVKQVHNRLRVGGNGSSTTESEASSKSSHGKSLSSGRASS